MEQMIYNSGKQQEYDKITEKKEVTKIAQGTIYNLCGYEENNYKGDIK
jgi:hypothetical protein